LQVNATAISPLLAPAQAGSTTSGSDDSRSNRRLRLGLGIGLGVGLGLVLLGIMLAAVLVGRRRRAAHSAAPMAVAEGVECRQEQGQTCQAQWLLHQSSYAWQVGLQSAPGLGAGQSAIHVRVPCSQSPGYPQVGGGCNRTAAFSQSSPADFVAGSLECRVDGHWQHDMMGMRGVGSMPAPIALPGQTEGTTTPV
jgi:hypothetical protein